MKKISASVALCFLLLSGCVMYGPDVPDENDETPPDNTMALCDMFGQQQIEQLIGETYLAEPFVEETEGVDSCKFYNTEDDPMNARNVNVITREADSGESAQEEYERAINVWKNNTQSFRSLQESDEGETPVWLWAYGSETTQYITYQENLLLIITLGHLEADEETLLSSAQELAENAFTHIL